MSKVTVYDNQGKEAGTITVSLSPLEAPAHKAYAVSIRRLLQRWRQGTVGHKTRGQVSMSNKKPWRQKGTGRARAGTSRSPLWRKGGVIFGPTPRTRNIAIPRAQRRIAMRSAMQAALESGKLMCIDHSLDGDKPSTKMARTLLANVGLGKKKVVVFLSYNDTQAYLSLRNMGNVHIAFYDQPNAFDLTNGHALVFFKKDENLFNDMVGAWK